MAHESFFGHLVVIGLDFYLFSFYIDSWPMRDFSYNVLKSMVWASVLAFQRKGRYFTLMRVLAMGILLLSYGCAHSPRKIGELEEQVSGLSDVSLDFHVKRFRLDNGLRILVAQNDRLPIFSYYTFFDVGGRYESKEQKTTGATHFLEHLMFKGTHKYPPGFFDKTIEGSGGNSNAYTTLDTTVYVNDLPTGNLEIIIKMEADRMHNLKISDALFESERSVIFEERRRRYENNPRGQLYLAMMQEMFKGTPYGGSVIGHKEDLISLTREQIEKFYKRFYTPDNAIVVVSGDVDPWEVYTLMKKHYGKLSQSQNLALFKKKKNDPQNYLFKGRGRRNIKLWGSSPTPLFMMAFKGEPLGTRMAFVMDILSSILGSGESSYLNQVFVRGHHPMLNNIYVSNYNLKYSGVFYIGGELLRGIGLKNFKKKLVKETRRMCKKAITERSLQKTKNQYLVDYYGELQTNAGMASFLGLRENFFGNYNFYKKELSIYDSIQIDEVREACQKIFVKKNSLFLSIWDRHSKSKKSFSR